MKYIEPNMEILETSEDYEVITGLSDVEGSDGNDSGDWNDW